MFFKNASFIRYSILRIVLPRGNLLSNNKILDWSKLEAFAENKINVTQKLEFVSERVENIVRKGENAGYQHFLLFQQCS